MNAEVKPCPFCGCDPDVEECDDGSVWVSCRDSSMKCPAYGNGAELELWNRRSRAGEDVKASPVVPVQKLEELEATIRNCIPPLSASTFVDKMTAKAYEDCANGIAQLIKEAKG